ncbi:MAG TPA: efflux RND transporter permease subunit [Planctomycetota bacterium]|nr:efflux RND transporter permease subunit [Planctomycetota bacterium]HRU52706.1 efflux RND transporter permease subunit [Planctomycetota bacterium]
MSISEISIKRKIAVSCVIIMFVFLGLKSFFNIGVDLLPNFDFSYAQITTIYPGASPEEVEVEVAKRLEDAVSSMDGIKHITSICMENACGTMMEFQLGVDIDITIHEIREKINTIIDDFPKTVETPQINKLNMNAISVVSLYLTGELTLDEMYDYVDDKLSNYFSSTPGVAGIRVHGGNEVELHVILNQERLISSNLTVPEIIASISANNIKLPAGRLRQHGREITVTYDAEFRDIEALRHLEISNTVGKRVYLGDIAEIKLMSKEIRQEGYLDQKLGIAIDIVKKSEANAVKVIEGIRKKYDDLIENSMLPSGMVLHWFKDTGSYIEASVNDAWYSVFLGIALTAFLLYLFLHDLRTTMICAIVIPISIVITFMAMSGLNYTFNTMTLVSIGCATGVLVDNAIVILESIFTRLNRGDNLEKAAAKGTNAVVNAVLGSALTNLVVFWPVMTMTGNVGVVLNSFAGVMVVTTLVAICISFTLTPILSCLLLKKNVDERSKWNKRMFFLWDKFYDSMVYWFNRSIKGVSRHSGIVIILIVVGCTAIMVHVYPFLQLSFFPQSDRSELSIALEFPSNSGLAYTRERTLKILEKIREKPYVIKTGTTVGFKNALVGQVSEGVYISQIAIMLKPKEERKKILEIADELRAVLATEENLIYNIVLPSPLGNTDVEFTAYITGPEFEELEKYSRMGMEILRKSGIGTDLDISSRPGKPRFNILPNRPIMKNLGINATILGTSVLGYFDGVEAGTYKVGTRTYDIRVKTEDRQGFDYIDNIVAGSIYGKPINLDTLVLQEPDSTSISLIRHDKERSAWIYGNPTLGNNIGEMVNILNRELIPQLPFGYRLAYYGQAEMMLAGASEFITVFITAIFLTFLMIAAIMESWSRPFLILFTIPLGFVGMFLFIYLTEASLSMIGLLGGVMMIGLVVNNAILIMDECVYLTGKGVPTHQAMIEATQNKFRPVLMTSISSVFGIIPMAFGTGVGSELRSSCGIGVFGGLLFSTFLTLYFIPALYFKFVRNTAYPKQSLLKRILLFLGIPVSIEK